jgi:hypothetical protein
MQVSAEIRWFWPDSCPEGLESWLKNGDPAPGGGLVRVDEYLHEAAQHELGLKLRGNKPGVEVKGLVTRLPADQAPGIFAGTVEIWCKWTSAALNLSEDPRIITRKQRWLRKLDASGVSVEEVPLGADEMPLDGRPLPGDGCNLELTRIDVDGPAPIWWTLGFESFGAFDRIESNLRRSVQLMEARHPSGSRPAFAAGRLLSYPAWLSECIQTQ